MSRIAKKPIEIPENVSVTVTESMVTIKGPKGELRFNSPVVVQVDGKLVKVGGGDQMAGMARTMIATIFANSVGCRNNTPTSNQRCAPNATCPKLESATRNTMMPK